MTLRCRLLQIARLYLYELGAAEMFLQSLLNIGFGQGLDFGEPFSVILERPADLQPVAQLVDHVAVIGQVVLELEGVALLTISQFLVCDAVCDPLLELLAHCILRLHRIFRRADGIANQRRASILIIRLEEGTGPVRQAALMSQAVEQPRLGTLP